MFHDNPAMSNTAAAMGHLHAGGSEAADDAELSLQQLQAAVTELFGVLRNVLHDERVSANECLRRAATLLRTVSLRDDANRPATGGLAPWQVRKVTNYIEMNLERAILNEELAGIARLHASHFIRAFRESVGDSPRAYIIRRRMQRAQGLMLSSSASLSQIALDCGLADQAHLSKLFRRTFGESPSAWRRARLCPPEVTPCDE